MIPAVLLPAVQKPPHDPKALVVTTQWLWNEVGFRKNLCTDTGSKGIQLEQVFPFRRSLGEANGTFGGLVLPSNVAVAPDGSIFLLDRATATLKRFEPCECRFISVPYLGGVGGKARELRNPGGIGICGGNIFICDTGVDEDQVTAAEYRDPAGPKRVAIQNHRLSVFSLRGYTLRGHWQPPARAYQGANAELSKLWQPFDVDFDGQGRVYVSDPANGCIHRFSPRGIWLGAVCGVGPVSHLAIDCQDRIYAVVKNAAVIKRLDPTGHPQEEIPTRPAKDGKIENECRVKGPAQFSSAFPKLPFEVDSQGRLHLAALCLPECCVDRRTQAKEKQTEFAVFDLNGNPVDLKLQQAAPRYETKGCLISAHFDSELYRCVWHRVLLEAEIPAGTRIEVATITSEVEFSPAEAQERFKQQSLSTVLTGNGGQKGHRDALVRSQPGRYLWLRLRLQGNGSASPVLRGVELEFPRVSLRRYLPAVFGAEPVSADFTDRFLSLLDTTFRSIESEIDNLAGYFDPASTPAERRDGKIDFLSWLASWVGLMFDRQWSEARRRWFLKQAGKLFPLRGTRKGLWLELLLYLGMEPDQICCDNDRPQRSCSPAPKSCVPEVKQPCFWQPPPLILENYQLRRWLFLGLGRLHDQAVLWGRQIVNRSQLGEQHAQADRTQLIMRQDPMRDPFHVQAHQFSVFVPARIAKNDAERKGLENLLKFESPAHTKWTIHYVEPRFRIGFQSTMGFNTAIGRWPQGVTLGSTKLRQGSVLSPPPGRAGRQGFILGKESRIGTTTELH